MRTENMAGCLCHVESDEINMRRSDSHGPADCCHGTLEVEVRDSVAKPM
jgi:hypothetical protein